MHCYNIFLLTSGNRSMKNIDLRRQLLCSIKDSDIDTLHEDGYVNLSGEGDFQNGTDDAMVMETAARSLDLYSESERLYTRRPEMF